MTGKMATKSRMNLQAVLGLQLVGIIRSSGSTSNSLFRRISVDASSVANATLSTLSTDDLMSCAGLCNLDASCQSLSYDSPSAMCAILNPFSLTNQTNPTHNAYLEVVGQPTEGSIFLVGGLLANGSATSDAEIVNPLSSSSACTKPPDYYMPVWAFAGGVLMNHVVACGGFGSSDFSNCYVHRPKTNDWQEIGSLPQATRHQKAISVGDLLLNIGGGAGTTLIANSQAFQVGAGSTAFTALPFTLCRHCMANINATHVLLVGGTRWYDTNSPDDTQNALILDVTSQQYFQMAGSFDQMRLDPFCGVITRSSGLTEMVLAGGSPDVQGQNPFVSSMIYSSSNNMWRAGPNLPSAMSAGGSVQYGGNTFLIIHPNGIYKYDVVNDAWITLPGKMATARNWFAFALVPPDYVQCS